MMLVSTGSKKYRMRVLYAVRLSKVPKPSVAVIEDVLVVSWHSGARLAIIIQTPGQPSRFGCQTFHCLKPISVMEIDMEALDGPASLMVFLDAIADWLS